MASLQYVLAYVSFCNCHEMILLHNPSRYLAFFQSVFIYVSLGHPSEKLLPTLFTSIGLLFSMCSYICVQSSSLTEYGSTLHAATKPFSIMCLHMILQRMGYRTSYLTLLADKWLLSSMCLYMILQLTFNFPGVKKLRCQAEICGSSVHK